MVKEDSKTFIRGLESGDLSLLRKVPKADLHNHAGLGSKMSRLNTWLDKPVAPPPYLMPVWTDFTGYLKDHLHPIIYSKSGFEYSIKAALLEGDEDGVVILEMSIDAQVVDLYPEKIDGLVHFLKSAHEEVAPHVDFRPEIGMNRETDLEKSLGWVIPMIDSGYFRSIDLYGDEMLGPPERFAEIYRYAREKGLKLKAHAGEYKDGDFVKRSIEVLELDAVQHGFQSAQNTEVVEWLAQEGVPLNICPTSNVRLARIPSIEAHPVRALYDNGVNVTINSDDIMIFDQTVSEEFLNLYQSGVFSAGELDAIRLKGLTY